MVPATVNAENDNAKIKYVIYINDHALVFSKDNCFDWSSTIVLKIKNAGIARNVRSQK